MNFLPDLYVRCEVCGGKRFNRQTLEVRFKGKSIGDVLEMRVDESRDFFDAQPKVKRGPRRARTRRGSATSPSASRARPSPGGEAQRVKLAAELGRAATGRTLYILDEPTTGLHFADVARLLAVLHRLADLGNTVLVIEHHLDVIKSADWVIDLGPGGGAAGGRVVAMGPPRRSPPADGERDGAVPASAAAGGVARDGGKAVMRSRANFMVVLIAWLRARSTALVGRTGPTSGSSSGSTGPGRSTRSSSRRTTCARRSSPRTSSGGWRR